MRLVVAEGIRSEAVRLIAVCLVLDDERASQLDVLEESAGALADLVADQIRVRAHDDRVEGAQVRIRQIIIGQEGRVQSEAGKGWEDLVFDALHVPVPEGADEVHIQTMDGDLGRGHDEGLGDAVRLVRWPRHARCSLPDGLQHGAVAVLARSDVVGQARDPGGGVRRDRELEAEAPRLAAAREEQRHVVRMSGPAIRDVDAELTLGPPFPSRPNGDLDVHLPVGRHDGEDQAPFPWSEGHRGKDREGEFAEAAHERLAAHSRCLHGDVSSVDGEACPSRHQGVIEWETAGSGRRPPVPISVARFAQPVGA